MRKKIIVTGANGQLGSEIRKIAGKYNFDFIYTDIDTLDLLDKDATDQFLTENEPDFIINCAAYTNVDKAEEEPDLAMKINANIPLQLADYCTRADSMLIHISTDYVFPGTHYQPLKEDSPTGSVSSYGKSKMKGEKNIQDRDNVIIMRTSWLYSSYGKNFVKSMIRLLKEKEEMRIVFDQVGTPTYAADLAEAVLHIISLPREKINPGIYHYSNEGVCSWYDLAVEIQEITRESCKILPIETKDYPLPAARPFYSIMNKEKIKSDYGIQIPHWKTSLQKCIGLIKKNAIKYE